MEKCLLAEGVERCWQVDCEELEQAMRKMRRSGTKGQLLLSRLQGQMNRQSMTPKDLFIALDASGDGIVAGHEFRRLLPQVLPGVFSTSDVAKLLHAIDVHANDAIDLYDVEMALSGASSQQDKVSSWWC